MNRTYVAKRLLEHGPLTGIEFVEITGWTHSTAHRTLQLLIDQRIVKLTNREKLRHGTRLYELASLSTAPGSQPLTGPRQSELSTGTTSSCHGSN